MGPWHASEASAGTEGLATGAGDEMGVGVGCPGGGGVDEAVGVVAPVHPAAIIAVRASGTVQRGTPLIALACAASVQP